MKSVNIDSESLSAVSALLSAADRDSLSYDGAVLSGPDAVIDRVEAIDWAGAKKQALKDYAAAKRLEAESKGIVLNGMVVKTDRASQFMTVGACMAAAEDPNFTASWKCADGSFVLLNAEQIIAVRRAITAHIASCFSAEAAVANSVNAGSITTRAQIDSAMVI